MSDTAARKGKRRSKAALWLLIGAGLALVAAANSHLIYVAFTSQPDCVDHVRSGERAAAPGTFSAAQSSCAPR